MCNYSFFLSFRRNDILAIVGEDLKNLWKLFDTARDVSEGKTFSNWKLQVSKTVKQQDKNLPLLALFIFLVHSRLCNLIEHPCCLSTNKMYVSFAAFREMDRH